MKRNEYLATGVNLIELDLLRSGPRMPMGEPAPPPAPYYMLVQKAWEWPRLDIWPVSLRQALPSLPVPLDREIAEVVLDLQSCFAEAFVEGRYREEVDYRQAPAPAAARNRRGLGKEMDRREVGRGQVMKKATV